MVHCEWMTITVANIQRLASVRLVAERVNMQIAAGSSNEHQRVFETKDGIERQPLAIIRDRLR